MRKEHFRTLSHQLLLFVNYMSHYRWKLNYIEELKKKKKSAI